MNVILLALDQGKFDAQRSLDELSALAQAANMEPVASVLQKRSAPEAGTVLGEGKLAEAKLIAHNLNAELAIFDGELSGSQMRNLTDILGIETIDRTLLILEIFQARAITNEGKLQTQLALERYRLPRLQGLGEVMNRQGGGGGGAAGARRGSGETQLELDRRYVHSRIDALEKKLEEVERRRGETRRARQKTGVPVVSLVGYTNVGKSSLMNALCGGDQVMEADMLFATLDPTARKLELPSGLTVVLVDTVGFVSRLPHHLVEAFKSTLEEAAFSDVIIKVADASDDQRLEQLAVTDEVLHSLDCDGIPQLVVYNKCDRSGAVSFDPDILLTSAKSGAGLDALKLALDEALSARIRPVTVLLPYDKLGLADILRSRGSVSVEEYRDTGVYYEGMVKLEDLYQFEPYLCKE